MNNVPLNECIPYHWYEVINGTGIIAVGQTIQYIKGGDYHLIIGDQSLDEIGITVSEADSERIMVKEIFF